MEIDLTGFGEACTARMKQAHIDVRALERDELELLAATALASLRTHLGWEISARQTAHSARAFYAPRPRLELVPDEPDGS